VAWNVKCRSTPPEKNVLVLIVNRTHTNMLNIRGPALLWELSKRTEMQPHTLRQCGRATTQNHVLSKDDLTKLVSNCVKAKPPTQLNKASLARAVVMTRGFRMLQRRFRRQRAERKAKALLRRRIRRKPRNRDCPITLEPLKRPVFVHVSETGYPRGYSLESLIQGILVTGKATDPITRVEYNAVELKRMDREAKQAGLQVGSAWAAIHDPERRREYEQARLREEMKDVCEFVIYDVYGEITEVLGQARVTARLAAESFDTATDNGRLNHLKDQLFMMAAMDFDRCREIIEDLRDKAYEVKMCPPMRTAFLGFLTGMRIAANLFRPLEEGEFDFGPLGGPLPDEEEEDSSDGEEEEEEEEEESDDEGQSQTGFTMRLRAR
jgi:hypothetical protein